MQKTCSKLNMKKAKCSKMRKFEFVDDRFICDYGVEDWCKRLPTRATKNSAGYDFYAPVTFLVKAHEKFKIMTNIKACMESDEALLLLPRSSVGIKKSCMLSNTVGLIDSDYYNNPSNDGNIAIEFYNFSGKDVAFEKGEKIVQGIFIKYLTVTDEEEVKAERTGGVGSTN